MRETRDETQEKKIFRRSSAFKNGVDPVWSVRIAEITSPAMPRGPNSRIQQPLRFVERSEVGWRGWDDPDLTRNHEFWFGAGGRESLRRALESFQKASGLNFMQDVRAREELSHYSTGNAVERRGATGIRS
jgi:hypothetical protein